MHEILWVCRTQKEAMEYGELYKELLGDPPGMYFVSLGGALAGRGFDIILIEAREPFTELEQRWIDELLPTKLFPEGRIVPLAHLEGLSSVPI